MVEFRRTSQRKLGGKITDMYLLVGSFKTRKTKQEKNRNLQHNQFNLILAKITVLDKIIFKRKATYILRISSVDFYSLLQFCLLSEMLKSIIGLQWWHVFFSTADKIKILGRKILSNYDWTVFKENISCCFLKRFYSRFRKKGIRRS